jgi:uncharacterized protein YneF (UPF0154 family)
MSTGIVVLIAIIALLVGAVGGFFLARKYMQDYLKKNPPVNEDMLRMMMMSMGQKPSEKKIRQNDATNEKPKVKTGFLNGLIDSARFFVCFKRLHKQFRLIYKTVGG